jgi:aconitate decarboxylase
MTDPIHAFVDHTLKVRFDDLPAPVVEAAKTFILDTLGVGIGGSTGPNARELVAALGDATAQGEARVWGTGESCSASVAALHNAYRTHCSEYDCIHEAAVVHVMTVVLSTALAGAERQGGIDGRRLIEAVVAGVDMTAGLGVAAKTGLRFFRPATAGAFGGTAALAKIVGLDADQMLHAFSLCYGQVSGTMQAHEEGSSLLALQIGFNARNAVTAVDLAKAGFTGPENILHGRFGYFGLIEAEGDATAIAETLGRDWRLLEVGHKPFPSGRATHGVIDACLVLKERHGLSADAVKSVRIDVPPLVNQLVGRPPKPVMAINYARLCARYTAACALIDGALEIDDFTDAAYARSAHQALAGRIEMVPDTALDPNALTPVTVTLEMTDGTTLTETRDEVYGNPTRPMTRAAQIEKLSGNCKRAATPLGGAEIDQLVACVDGLETLADVTDLVTATLPASAR